MRGTEISYQPNQACPVFQLTRPTRSQIDAFLEAQRDVAFSYREVGATRSGSAPAGYVVDHNRVELGHGRDTFDRAVAAMHAWKMSRVGWSTVYPELAPTLPGTNVVVVVNHYGFWSLNGARVVYTFDDEQSAARRAGFAYGTLRSHAEVGEERFTVEWRRDDDSVWYDVYAFSRPGHVLAQLGYPLVRRLQRRFGRATKLAMRAAVSRDQ